jgi:tRNA G18 (ribose-2'-O)-methylase SpoU
VKTVSLFDATFSKNSALVLSNEGHGLSPTILPALSGGLRIPMAAGVESLNVATAGAIVLYSIFGRQL